MERPDPRQIATLELFNRKVEHLLRSGFAKRFKDTVPEVVVLTRDLHNVTVAGGIISFDATMLAHFEEFNQDEIDAFVLTFRMFSQNNDPISVGNIAVIYKATWMPPGAWERFVEARNEINLTLDSDAIIRFGDRKVQTRELVDIVIYGGMAHSNPMKAGLFDKWASSEIAGLLWAEFFGAMRTMLPLLEYIHGLNSAVIAHVKGW